ncbi:MAG TPA: ABC transporter permease, partial [Wenzhouxiangella sp.]|nr:ABC transporter permease [Wenzhouxiangella sp.]
TLGSLALQLNHEIAGARTILLRTANELDGDDAAADGSFQDRLISIHPQWGEQEFWSTLKIMGEAFTLRHYLGAFDHRYDAMGEIVARPEYEQIHLMLFGRTLWASALIVLLTLLLGFPIAYHIANSPPHVGNLLLILVLLPFWTALLVRTAAWIVLLQQQGVLNDLLVALGLISDDGRLRMMHNMTGTIVAMTHIMLPFMVLPLYSVMKSIPPVHMRAAASLGAPPFLAFVRVYLPQTKPGIGAGCILVFILCIGYYITPALVGGRTGQFISSFVAYHIQQSLNWGLAAALSGVILVAVLLLYLLYSRVFGGDSIRLG